MSIFAATKESTEQEQTPPSALDQISIRQLYFFLWKLAGALLLFSAPIFLIMWFIEYASSH
jgi:hypothetical protein